ncbi:spermatogenesis-associated protein 21-like [Trachemys scripta elegans]|uniref:spermatogenesis-associated protein 21-like n=1 Tax=Trachemys scripta elegans TaxID=31138 RepID=UPI0015517F2A|nr:spermatogenesis-associated protein 21-like [Trachemys scripta elegans]
MAIIMVSFCSLLQHYEKADKQVKEEVEIQVSVALLSLQEEEDPKFPVHTKDHVQTPNLEILAVEEDPLSSLKTEAYVQSSNPDILSGEEEEEEEKSELVEGGELEFLSLLHFEVQEQSSHLETSVEEPLTFLKTEALVQSSNLEILEKQKLPSLLDTETEVLISDLDIRDAEKTSLSTDTGLNVPTKNRSRNLSGLFSLLDIPGEHEEPLTQKQIAAFNDVFKVFNSTEGNIKMRGLKLILHSVGINVTHQEIREALNRADIDGDGQVNFTDFVTVLTDDQRFAQSMVRPKESIIHDPYSVETLFFEVLTKLVEMSALPMKSEREVVR